MLTTSGVGSFVEFANASTAGNASITNGSGGSTFFVNASTASNASITNNGSGSVTEFSDTSTAGSASIANINGSVTFFIGNSTAGSAHIVTNNASFLEFNDASTAGNAIITTNSGGITAFQNTASGGQAQFITNSGGSFDISGLSSGGTAVGSIAGAGNFNLGSKQLTVGANNLGTVVSGTLADGGVFGGTGASLVKVGVGTLTLSGANTYTGSTTINGGTLEVDGSIADTSNVTVNSGATLSGAGTVDPVTTTIMGGATLAPGNAANPTGTLTLTGNLAFRSGALYLVEVTPAAASSTAVSGTAALAGAVQVNFASGNYVSKTYTILTAAGGLSGAFSGLANVNLPTGASDSLSYDADDVYLNLTPGFTNFIGLNVNQQSIANALTNYFNTTGDIPTPFFNLTRGGLTQIDGETNADAEKGAFRLMSEFLSLMLDPFVNGRASNFGTFGSATGFAAEADFPPDVALAYNAALKAPPKPTVDPRWTAWGSAFGGSSVTNGNPTLGTNNVGDSTFGFASGEDYHFTADSVLGFALAGGGTNWGLAQGLGGGRSVAFQAGVYSTTHFGPAYLAAALAFTNNWMTSNRIALGDQLTASFNGQSFGARFETGYRYAVMPTIGMTPYAALQSQLFHTPSYAESDLTGRGFGLAFNAMNATDTRSELGARFDDLTTLDTMPLILWARLAWTHDWVTNPTLGAVFETLPGASFVVNGAAPPNNSALASAGAELHLAADWTAIAKFDGEFSSGSRTYSGTGILRYSW
jgi:autotransporter-associated beta strand protein